MDITSCIENGFDAMLEALDRLIRIPSVGGEAEEGAPFGKAPLEALNETIRLASEMGFYARNCYDRAATIDLYESGEPAIGILCHADVVPAGNGWTYEPFKATLDSGKIFGRGSIDDKGPLVAALFAMKYLKENVSPAHNIRLIVGTDEERGSGDLKYYREREKLPAVVFTPDASYPVINTEKGRATASFCKTFSSPHVVSANGGGAVNAVPDRAHAVIKDISVSELEAAAEKCSKISGVKYDLTDNNDGTVSVLARGVGAHASLPEGGVNAVTGIILLLSEIDSEWKSVTKLCPHGETDGKSLGIACSDDVSGALSFSFDVFDYSEENFSGVFDIRFPVCMSGDKLEDMLTGAYEAEGFSVKDYGASEPHHTSADSVLVSTLVDVYKEAASEAGIDIGDDVKPLSTGGGTYVHGIPGGVAFGPELPGVDNHMHGADEFISVDNFKLCTKLIYMALERLDKAL